MAPNRHQTKKSPSASVGSGVDEDVGLGRLRRPRPCSSHFHLVGTRPPSTPRATLKALTTSHLPPSPLRIVRPCAWLPGFGAVWGGCRRSEERRVGKGCRFWWGAFR